MRIFLSLILTTFLVSGCGGGTSGGGNDIPPVRSAGKLAGVAHDAPLRNADVKIYDFTAGSKGELLSQTKTDENGDYSINITTADKPILIVAGDSGSYTEEASGKSINLAAGQNISAVTYYQSGEILSLQVTPFTHLARCYAEYLVSDGESVPDALNLANSKIAAIAGVEIIQTKPIDVTDINSANIELTPGLKYGFLTAAISASMVDVSEANGLSPHSQTFLTSMQYSRVACNDIKADGLLDGYGYIDNDTVGALSFGTYPITPSFYRDLLAQRILSFTISDKNKTALDVQQLLVFANALSTNTDSVWAGQSGQPVDISGPTIKALIAENSFIGGSAELPFFVEDPIGVNTIKFYIDGALVSTQGSSAQTFNINTNNYLDGLHTIKVIAADIIGNETTLETTYNISNTGPAINLTSETVVGNEIYVASGTWVSSGADIQSIIANGVEATINPNGTWEANLTLSSGVNSFGVIATDVLSNSTSQTYKVGVDKNKPEVLVKNLSFPITTYEGQYNLCEYGVMGQSASNPICVRSDRVSLNGALPDRNLQGNDFIYIEFGAGDVVGAGVYSQFEELSVEYKYVKNGSLVVDWKPLLTGYKSSIPGSTNGYFILPVSTEYLGDDWFNTVPSDSHVLTVRVTDAVGNMTEKKYEMQFDVLLYDVIASSSSNVESVMNQPFASRSTIYGNTVTTTATIENTTYNPVYFQLSYGDTHTIEQIYESAIRVNRYAVKETHHWQVYKSYSDNIYTPPTSSWTDVSELEKWTGSGWETIYPTVIMPDYKYVFQDVVPDTAPVDWDENIDMICAEEETGYLIGETNGTYMTWAGFNSSHTVKSFADYKYGPNTQDFACNKLHGFNINESLWYFTKKFRSSITYENIYEPGYPRNELTETILNHSVKNSIVEVYNKTRSLGVDMIDGYYRVPPGESVEIVKSVKLPNLTSYDDSEVANMDSFGSYEQKDLDKSISWALDTAINLDLFAVKGGTAYYRSAGSIGTYTIER